MPQQNSIVWHRIRPPEAWLDRVAKRMISQHPKIVEPLLSRIPVSVHRESFYWACLSRSQRDGRFWQAKCFRQGSSDCVIRPPLLCPCRTLICDRPSCSPPTDSRLAPGVACISLITQISSTCPHILDRLADPASLNWILIDIEPKNGDLNDLNSDGARASSWIAQLARSAMCCTGHTFAISITSKLKLSSSMGDSINGRQHQWPTGIH